MVENCFAARSECEIVTTLVGFHNSARHTFLHKSSDNARGREGVVLALFTSGFFAYEYSSGLTDGVSAVCEAVPTKQAPRYAFHRRELAISHNACLLKRMCVQAHRMGMNGRRLFLYKWSCKRAGDNIEATEGAVNKALLFW